ncbi:uncharacterized protein LOC113324067 [Papaver somniferum]|uniref:uncharacterized protein LOC113324067 n=1 Tax=Papaver somniferum TaxID=3469 RepID=UPI000E704218|nr:uncharacterized protein LOC113324067 [Papaver somniferum]
MENAVGLMTVFAVSGSVALVALQAHKRLLSDFMKRVELQLGTNPNAGVERMANACSHSPIQSKTHSILKMAEGSKVQQKKKVRFADDAIEPSSNNKEYRLQRSWPIMPNAKPCLM